MNQIRNHRQAKGFTQARLAKELGIGQPYYSAIENGSKPFPFHCFWAFVTTLHLTPQEMYNVAKWIHR